jgi:hypothetical protein
MVKTTVFIGFVLLAVAFNANASDRDRIDQLEKENQEIKLRLSKLESLLSNPGNAHELVTSSEGWKSVVNWRKLTVDMSASDVQIILGAPIRVDGGNVASWYYQNGGSVSFFHGKVHQWEEPQQ